MSKFMQSWNDTEHKQRKEIIKSLEDYDINIDEFYKGEVENLIADTIKSRYLYSKKKGTSKQVKNDVVNQLTKVFNHMRIVHTTLSKRLKAIGSKDYTIFDNQVHRYLNHLASRINAKKTKKEHHYSGKSRDAKKGKGVRRYAEQRAQKQDVQKMHVNEEGLMLSFYDEAA